LGAISASCAALGISRASLQRSIRRRSRAPNLAKARTSPPRTLQAGPRQTVLDLLRSARFADLAPAEIYATLLDEGIYHCSISTMYRILTENSEVRERRRQLRHPAYTKPELLAIAPNQVWSWDITKLKGPAKWTYFYLYVILDIFSRRVVGWCIADAENAALFKELFDDTMLKQDVPPGR
jgi:putative transposase